VTVHILRHSFATHLLESGEAEASPRRALGLPEEAFVVGLFGRLAPWTGQEVLLEAIAALMGDVHALIVGKAWFQEDGYAAGLHRRVAELRLAGRVHLLGHRNDIPALRACCDVIAHTSTAPDPFGRVIVEGMLSGRPVLATLAGGAVEVVRDGRDLGGFRSGSKPPSRPGAGIRRSTGRGAPP
jgi:glycosyltransferase involved in cell wall biosynthesis